MAFLAPLAEALPEIGEAAGAAGEAGGAAGEAGGGGGGLMSKVGSLFKSIPSPGQSGSGANDPSKQQNVGASRNEAFQDAATSVRSAVRSDAGGMTSGGMD